MRTKICLKCQKELELIYFNKHKEKEGGFQAWCKNCYNKYWKTYGPEHRADSMDRCYQRLYGITTKERNQMLMWQGYKCVICQKKENGRKLCVDHNHKTGQIGMLLCNECNFGKSCADNIKITAAYLEYLKTYHA